MIPKSITFKELKFENQYYVAGHFNFIFNVSYEDNESEQEIKRRYNEIRALYKTLLLKAPGCRIPNIPSKSIWLKINYGNEKEVRERQEGIMEFLNHIIQHKILRKNKYVIKFFSPEENSFTFQNNLKSEKENNDKDDFDDVFESNIMDIKDDKKDENNLDEDDIEPLDDFVQEYNNKKKGIVSKGKKMLGNVYNYVKSYTNNSNKKNEEGEEDNNANENNDENSSSVFYKKLTKEDYDYIKKNTKELGEDYNINDYNEKINRLNEGVKIIIENLEKLTLTRKKSLDALKEIVNKDKDIKSLNKKNKKDDFDINEEEKGENDIDLNHKRSIKKISKYCIIQKGFLDSKVDETINKIKKYQELLQDLLDIYARKKEHINYLGRLHSQKEEVEKQKENSNLENPVDKIKIEEFEKKLEHEKKFIKKINKDLKYEIGIYKDNKQKEIYNYINDVYKEKAKKIKDSVEYLNKEKLEDEEEQRNEKDNINNENSNDYLNNKNDSDF
jgi:hypothetical protein